MPGIGRFCDRSSLSQLGSCLPTSSYEVTCRQLTCNSLGSQAEPVNKEQHNVSRSVGFAIDSYLE